MLKAIKLTEALFFIGFNRLIYKLACMACDVVETESVICNEEGKIIQCHALSLCILLHVLSWNKEDK